MTEVLAFCQGFDDVAVDLNIDSSVFDQIQICRYVVLPVDIVSPWISPFFNLANAYLFNIFRKVAENTVITHDFPDRSQIRFIDD